jgi:hypothetical protein
MALLGGERPGRPALCLVRIEQRRARPAGVMCRQLPAEVVGVLDAHVEPERAGRRHLVGGVAGDEHVADAVPVGDPRGRRPGHRAHDADRHVEADRPTDERRRAFPIHARRGVAALVGADDEEPAVGIVDRQQHAVGRGVADRHRVAARPDGGIVAQEVDRAPSIRDVLGQGGLEQDADVVDQRTLAFEANADLLADRAVGTIGADDVPRPDGDRPPGQAVDDPRLDRRPGGRQRLELVVEPDVGAAQGADVLEQDGLESVLRDHHPRRRAERLGGRRQPAAAGPLEPFADQAGAAIEEAVLLGRQAGGPDAVLDPPLPHDLHRPHVQAAGLRMDRRAGVALDEQRGDPAPRQHDRGGQADRSGAHDQDRDVDDVAVAHALAGTGTSPAAARATGTSCTVSTPCRSSSASSSRAILAATFQPR